MDVRYENIKFDDLDYIKWAILRMENEYFQIYYTQTSASEIKYKINDVLTNQVNAFDRIKNIDRDELLKPEKEEIDGVFIPDILRMKVNCIYYNKLPLDIESNDDKIFGNCFIHYVKSIYGKRKGFINKIKEIENIKVWTVETIYNFLIKSNISFEAYTQSMILLKKHIVKDDKNFKFIFIVSISLPKVYQSSH